MITKEDKIKIKIGRLKNIQDNLKFGMVTRLVLYVALVIFLLTLITLLINYYDTFLQKVIAFFGGLILYIVLTLYFYKTEFKWREKKLNDVASEIERQYDILLK